MINDSIDDEKLLDSFRDTLRDGIIAVWFHGATGQPMRGNLELQEDKVTLLWENKQKFRYFQQRTAMVNLRNVRSVREGRQTTNFIRTIKYVDPEELPANDERCLSLCTPSECEHAQLVNAADTFDIEFDDVKTRNIALSFFLNEANLSGTIDLMCDPGDIPLPQGWVTRCFQLYSHPSFELLVLVCVVLNMLFIALKPFIFDDDQLQVVSSKPKMTENFSPLEFSLLVVLTIEQVTKVIGLEGLQPLLCRKWDVFDFIVVWISWIAVLPNSSLAGFNVLSLRLFRGVRMFKHWKGFREIVETFLTTLPMAVNALLCYCYYLFLFAILGMYLFNDSLSHRCAALVPSSTINVELSPQVASMQSAVEEIYMPSLPGRFCRMKEESGCRAPFECKAMSSPNNGYTGFHSFQASFLTMFLSSLRSGFGTSVDGVIQATSYFSIIYFVVFMVLVSYMILSLFVGIVRGSYIAVSIVHASKLDERKEKMENYMKKQRVGFPKGTDIFPDVVQLVMAKWRGYRVQATDSLLNSPLFTPTADPDDAFLSRFRLRQHCIFYILEPESPIMDKIASVCESLLFEHFMNTVVFINAVLFAMEYHGMSRDYARRLYAAENLLIILYAAEFFFVCANAGGLRNYLKNPWNRLDFIILTAASLEFVCLVTSLFLYTDSYARAIFVLRLFRLVRPFRVVRKKNELLQVLDAILASVPAFLSLVTFHILLNSVFAILGMNLFGGKFPLSMRSHYNTFGDSMLTLFKISCGGDIWKIFHASLQASSFSVALGYYMAYFILCVYIVLNFMLVVLLRNFAMKGDERKKMLSDLFQERMLVMQRIHHFDEYTFLQEFRDLFQSEIMYATLSGSAEKRAKIELSASEEIKLRLLRVLPTSDFLKIKGYSRGNGTKYTRLDGTNPPLYNGKRLSQYPGTNGTDPEIDHRNGDSLVFQSVQSGRAGRLKASLRRFFGGDWLTSDISLFIFPPHSRFRLKCRRLEKETDKFIFSVIVVRTLLLTLQSPLYSSLIQELTTLSDTVFAMVLLFEFIIKVVSRGFLFTPHSYLSNPWNQINMVVLMACSLLLLLPHSTMIMLFRLGRAFGPIRVFYRVKTFRVITEALRQSAKQIFYCVILALFLFYSFATFGMQFFAGKFSLCSDPSVASRAECEGYYWNAKSGILMPRVWGNLAGMHFDHIGGAMGSVLVLVSKKGWLPVLNLAMDIVDGDHQPVQNASAYFALFFVAFIFFSRFYMLKVFGGIIMNNFRCYNGTLLLTNLQLIWMRNKQAIVAMRPKYPLPQNKVMEKAQLIVQTRSFRVFISMVVMLHTFLLAWYRSPIRHETTNYVNQDSIDSSREVWGWHYVFSMIYAIDAVMCVVSMGWKDFLMKGFTWRTANTCTAFIMLVGPMLSDSPVLLVLGMTRAFDFKHISLVFERFHSIKTLFETLLASVRLSLKVTLLLGYVIFVFAIVGMQLFSLTKWNYGLDANLNYVTFPTAYATFVKFTAGEDWYDTFQASSVGSPKCTTAGFFMSSTYASDCGSRFFSAIFYPTFYILVVLILQNLYTATVVDAYVSMSAVGENKEESLQLLGFRSDDLRHFQAVWSEFDKNALGYLHKKALLRFLTQLEPPLGLGSHKNMLNALVTEDTPPSAIPALVLAVHQKRREMYHDIEARVAELSYRLRVSQDDLVAADFSSPASMIRFTDLLLVLTERIVPLESLTVQEKVDEVAIRGYVYRHRQAIRIQATFQMYRVLRRKNKTKRKQVLRTQHVCPSNNESLLGKYDQVSSPEVVACTSMSQEKQVLNVSEAKRRESRRSVVTPIEGELDSTILATSTASPPRPVPTQQQLASLIVDGGESADCAAVHEPNVSPPHSETANSAAMPEPPSASAQLMLQYEDSL